MLGLSVDTWLSNLESVALDISVMLCTDLIDLSAAQTDIIITGVPLTRA